MFPFFWVPGDSSGTQNPATSFLHLKTATHNCLDKQNSKSKSRSFGQSVLVSYPIWGPRPDFYYCQAVLGFLICGALSDERTAVVYNWCWSSPAQSFTGLSPAGLILLSQIRDSYNLEGQVPVFIFPRNRVAQALGSFLLSCTTRALWKKYSNPSPRGLQLSTKSKLLCDFTPINSSWPQAPWGSGPQIFSIFYRNPELFLDNVQEDKKFWTKGSKQAFAESNLLLISWWLQVGSVSDVPKYCNYATFSKHLLATVFYVMILSDILVTTH
jgi:hypothetical protein